MIVLLMIPPTPSTDPQSPTSFYPLLGPSKPISILPQQIPFWAQLGNHQGLILDEFPIFDLFA
jgi:hypothetical protein